MPNRLGLAYVARKLVLGTEFSIKAIQSQEAKLVLIANDASKATIKKITDKANFYNIEVNLKYDTKTLNQPIGKENIKVICILDEGFANMYK